MGSLDPKFAPIWDYLKDHLDAEFTTEDLAAGAGVDQSLAHAWLVYAREDGHLRPQRYLVKKFPDWLSS